jgi:dihydropteroate synthase
LHGEDSVPGDGVPMTGACLGGIVVGDGTAVAVMGALNVSPESFYAGSIVTRRDDLLRAAEAMVTAGAAFVDVGAMSTAPYRAAGRISEQEEADRLTAAIRLLVRALDVPVSADTSRGIPTRAALEAGARIINDVTGLTGDPQVGELVARAGAGIILMACERGDVDGRKDPITAVAGVLGESLERARRAGIDSSVIAVDPGIGFFRRQRVPWPQWDTAILSSLDRLRGLGRPVCVGVSRKSFIGELAGAADPGCRLPGSLAATAAAVLAGAHLVRTHDVEETVQAVRVAEAIRRAREQA